MEPLLFVPLPIPDCVYIEGRMESEILVVLFELTEEPCGLDIVVGFSLIHQSIDLLI